MIVLGIESTCHTFAIGVVNEEGEVLVDVREVLKPEPGKGFVPKELFAHHVKVAGGLLKEALATIDEDELSAIAFSQGPGIPNALRVGAAVARFLSLSLGKPLVGVNHAVAHIEIGKLMTEAKDPIVVYTSGGNTQIIAYSKGRYRVFGETLDLPVGNAIDTLARKLGIEPPYGPNFDKVAAKGKWIDMPYVVKGMDVSFSGILSEALRKFKKGYKVEDICYSFQEVVFSMLTEVTERAVAHTNKQEILLVGGVANSKRFQQMISTMCQDRGCKSYVVPSKYAGDNGVMIAWTGMLLFKHGVTTPIEESAFKQKWRVDEVDIPYINL